MRIEHSVIGLVLGGVLGSAACSGSSESGAGSGGSATSGGASGSATGGGAGKGGNAATGGNAGKGGGTSTGGASGSGGKGGSAGTESGDAGESSSSGGSSGAGGGSGRGGSAGSSAGSGGAAAGGGGTGGMSPLCELTTDLIGSCLLPESGGVAACNEYYDGSVYTEELITGICEPNGGTYSAEPCPDTSLEDADVLGCCSTIGGFNRNCYYGEESDRETYSQICEAVGCPLTEE